MSLTRYEPAHPRLQRSELAVPGSQPTLFRKALESEVDYVFLDLERASRSWRACSSTIGATTARPSACA